MKNIIRGLLAIAASGLAMPGIAESSQQYTFDIERKSLKAMLTELSKKTGLQVGLFVETGGKEAMLVGPLKGVYTIEAALTQLLEESGLTFRRVNEITIAVTQGPKNSSRDPDQRKWDRLGRPSLLRAIEGIYDGQVIGPPRLHSVAAVTAANNTETPTSEPPETRLEEVLVTGSHIRGVTNNTAPIMVLDRTYIESTGISTANRLIEALPQNFALASEAGVLVPGVSAPRDQGSSINLRGIGEGTTLVLLNGRRMPLGFAGSAVEISAIPVSAVERVEVLTDGASAMYGSDAVGGVVNFVMKQDFEGAETRLRAGWADGGVNEYRASQVLGGAWHSGNAVASVDFYQRDLLASRERSFVPDNVLIGSLYPQDKNYSAVFSGRQDVSNASTVFADVLYAKRDSYNEAGSFLIEESYTTDNPQLAATAGLSWRMGQDWNAELTGGYARNKLDQRQSSITTLASGQGAFLVDSEFNIRSGQLKADGSLGELAGGDIRMAVGADWRSESLATLSTFESGLVSSQLDFNQIVRSAFAELYVPLVGARNSKAGLRALELSIAGRFEDYSSFGSSLDPQFGVMWEPLGRLRLRARYGTSYKAPKLSDYALSFNQARVLTSTDPGMPGGVSRQMQVAGADAGNYSAQESESLSVGLEFSPESAPSLLLGLNYYQIDFSGRIATPPVAATMLSNQASFADLIIRNPSAGQVNEYLAIGQLGSGLFICNPRCAPGGVLDPASIQVIVDRRRRNLSVLETSGLDFSGQYRRVSGANAFSVSALATYILKLQQSITASSAALDFVDTYNNPPRLRFRGSMGWQRGPWSANLFANYVDSYVDNRTPARTPIDSYTTVDVRLACDIGRMSTSGFWSGVTLAMSAQNVLDENPPHTAILSTTTDMGFDATNANPLGRFIAAEITKSW